MAVVDAEGLCLAVLPPGACGNSVAIRVLQVLLREWEGVEGGEKEGGREGMKREGRVFSGDVGLVCHRRCMARLYAGRVQGADTKKRHFQGADTNTYAHTHAARLYITGMPTRQVCLEPLGGGVWGS